MLEQGYVHPRHRSLHGPLMLLAVFSVFFSTWTLFLGGAEAINIDADVQCKAGGVVGQPCKDTTNGYTTNGHCTHIQICAADSWPKAPKGCQPGQVAGRDCPYGKNPMQGPNPAPRPINIATSTIYDTPATSIGAMDLFGKAFGDDVGEAGYVPSGEQKVIGTTSIEGIQYLITDDNEKLEVGKPLTPAPPPPPPRELRLGEVYSLGPVQPNQQQGNGGQAQRGYSGTYSFSGPPSGSQGGVSVQEGGNIIGNIMHSIASMFGGQRPADELVVVSIAQPVMIVADISLYYQAQQLSSPQLLDIGWDSRLSMQRDLSAKRPSVSYLLRDALAHTAHIGIDLLTADLTAARADLSRALSSGGQALQGIGQSLSLSLSRMFSR